MGTQLQRKVVDTLRANAPLVAFSPTVAIWGGYIPDNAELPFLLVRDEGESYDWITEFSRMELHRLTLRAYGHGPTTADAYNSAERLMDLAEDTLNWIDIMNQLNQEIPGVSPESTMQHDRDRAVEDKRSKVGRFVYRSRSMWEVRYEFEDLAWKRW